MAVDGKIKLQSTALTWLLPNAWIFHCSMYGGVKSPGNPTIGTGCLPTFMAVLELLADNTDLALVSPVIQL